MCFIIADRQHMASSFQITAPTTMQWSDGGGGESSRGICMYVCMYVLGCLSVCLCVSPGHSCGGPPFPSRLLSSVPPGAELALRQGASVLHDTGRGCASVP